MVSRKKNLLDAFTASALEGRPIIGGKKDVQASAAGPSASKTPSATPSGAESSPSQLGNGAALEPSPAAPREVSTLRRALGEPAIRITAGLGVLALIAAFWLGRRSGAGAASDEPAMLAASGPGLLLRPGGNVAAPKDGDLGKANQTTAQIGTTHDQAFMNARNQFTVRVVQYKDDEAGKKAARASQDYLRREGYPVITPIVIGKNLIVCVGYAAKYTELEQLTAFVQALRGPDPRAKKPPFESAYIVNIDDVVQR